MTRARVVCGPWVDDPDPSAASNTANTAGRRGTRPRQPVLVVDDEAVVRHLIMRMLEANGFDVIGAGNGEEALSLLRHGMAPRVIVLDLWMPIVDGWEFMDRAKTHAPVVVITGVQDDPRPLPECVVRFLKKPIGEEELLAAVRAAGDANRRPRGGSSC